MKMTTEVPTKRKRITEQEHNLQADKRIKSKEKVPTFDLQTFMTSGKHYQRQNFGVTLNSILSEVQERHLCELEYDQFDWLQGEVRRADHSRKAWCNTVNCNRTEALKHPHNGFTWGEYGCHYFYFEHAKKRPFTDSEVEHLQLHTACCFAKGQCCLFDLDEDEDEYEGDPCECHMGEDNGSYVFHLGIGKDTIQSEKQYGLAGK